MIQMFTAVKTVAPHSKIFIHGYDYAPVVSRYFVDEANKMIAGLAPHFCDGKDDQFTHIDFRNSLASYHWLEDGIHPMPAGFHILAKKFNQALMEKNLMPTQRGA